jgi:hypothetical protein
METNRDFLPDYILNRARNLRELKAFRDSSDCPPEWRPFLNDAVSRAEQEIDHARAILNDPDQNPILDPNLLA